MQRSFMRWFLAIAFVACAATVVAQTRQRPAAPPPGTRSPATTPPDSPAVAPVPKPPVETPVTAQVAAAYLLAPEDSVTIHATGVDEISERPIRIDPQGNIRLALIGRVHAAGLTVDQLETELTKRLDEFVNDPHVSVSLTTFHSQPISVLGAVVSPGVQQLEGEKSLFEVLSKAGGLRQDAGYRIRITRRIEEGKLPLEDATPDASGKFTVGSVNVKAVLDATDPKSNIAVRPNDVISVPKGELVYVIGNVKRAGGFVLNEKAHVSVLQALALAEGMDRNAKASEARILRVEPGNPNRKEIAVDLRKIIDGKAPDQVMNSDDILFIPNNVPRSAALRGLESALQIGTGLAIYRP